MYLCECLEANFTNFFHPTSSPQDNSELAGQQVKLTQGLQQLKASQDMLEEDCQRNSAADLLVQLRTTQKKVYTIYIYIPLIGIVRWITRVWNRQVYSPHMNHAIMQLFTTHISLSIRIKDQLYSPSIGGIWNPSWTHQNLEGTGRADVFLCGNFFHLTWFDGWPRHRNETINRKITLGEDMGESYSPKEEWQ